jgi:hypothetical protein
MSAGLTGTEATLQGWKSGAVVVQAGRRIDAPGAPLVRFPLANVPSVRQRIRQAFLRERAGVLVSGAACGTDLLALDLAGELGLERIVVLSSPPDEFRKSSVIDRPGDWGPVFDKLLRQTKVQVAPKAGDPEPYLTTNLKLLDAAEAVAASRNTTAIAFIVWDGKSRGPDDVTEHLMQNARSRKMRIVEIPTL